MSMSRLFNTCLDWVSGKVYTQSSCGTSVGIITVTDLAFADDAVFHAESQKVLVMDLEMLQEKNPKDVLDQNLCQGVWRFPVNNNSVCSCMWRGR